MKDELRLKLSRLDLSRKLFPILQNSLRCTLGISDNVCANPRKLLKTPPLDLYSFQFPNVRNVCKSRPLIVTLSLGKRESPMTTGLGNTVGTIVQWPDVQTVHVLSRCLSLPWWWWAAHSDTCLRLLTAITKLFKRRVHTSEGHTFISVHLFHHCMNFSCWFAQFLQEFQIDSLLHNTPQNHRRDKCR